MVSKSWLSKHQKNVKLEDNPLVDLLAKNLPECVEPDEIVYWISNKRNGRFSPTTRKLRPVLIEFTSVADKHKLLKMSKQLHQNGLTLDDWLTELQQQLLLNSRGAPLTLTSKF